MESKISMFGALAGIVSVIVVLCVILYGQAQINKTVSDVAEAEKRVEEKLDAMGSKVDWLYGYHRINGHHENLTRVVETPAPVAMPKPVLPLED